MCASESRVIAELTAVSERLQAENAGLRAEVEGLREHIGELEAKLGVESASGRGVPAFVKPKRGVVHTGAVPRRFGCLGW